MSDAPSHPRTLARRTRFRLGEVYRARDTKLGRDVAIKILPDVFVNDPERVVRFQREAQALAALNHPHIAQIYGFEDTGPVRALVMELVEGPTLADRIAHGPIPLDEALPIARQMADAQAGAIATLDLRHFAAVTIPGNPNLLPRDL